MRRFYGRWLGTAFGHSWGVADFISGILGLAVPLVMWYFPGANLSDLIWQIPLGFFAAIGIARFVLAPWWMHNEDKAAYLAEKEATQTERTKEAVTREESIRRLTAERDQAMLQAAECRARLEARPATAADVRDRLVLLSREGHRLLHAKENPAAWLAVVSGYVGRAFRKRHVEDFTLELDAPVPEGADPVYQRAALCVNWLERWSHGVTDEDVSPDLTADQAAN